MYQLPRASRPSQPKQCGTLGHLAMAAMTMSSIERLYHACESSHCPTASGMARTWPGSARKPLALGKPTCPPCSGCQSVTLALTCCAMGNELAGTKGSLRALSARAGRRTAPSNGLAEARRPVVVGVAKTVQRCGEQVVEGVQVARGQQRLAVEQAGVLFEFLQGLGHHGGKEHARVNQPVEALANGMSAGGQIERRAHRSHRAHRARRALANLASPAQQGIAAQRHAHRQQRAPGCFVRKALEHPVDLVKITGVVGARRAG